MTQPAQPPRPQHPKLDDLIGLARQAWPEIAQAAADELQAMDTMHGELWPLLERGLELMSQAPSYKRSAAELNYFRAVRSAYERWNRRGRT